jgi:hypothetical protein
MTRVWAAIAITGAVGACSLPAADPQAQALAKSAFEQLRRGDLTALSAEISAADFGPDPTASFERMRKVLPEGEPKPGKMIGFNSFAGTGGSTLTLTYAFDYPDAEVTSQVVLAKEAKQPSGWIIRGFHINVGDAPRTETPAPSAPADKPHPKPQVT